MSEEDVGLLIAPQLCACVLEFTPMDASVASLHLQVGKGVLDCDAYSPNSTSVYPPFLESLRRVLEGDPTEDVIFPLELQLSCTWAMTLLLEGCDREDRPVQSESQLCSVIGLIC